MDRRRDLPIGPKGDDNALAETTNGLYKTECVYGPDTTGWNDVADLELAMLSWVHWFNHDRLHGHRDHVPPAERFGDRVVLDGVDLDVPRGRVVGLLGPNGAGKTTLMRILFGVLTPDQGSVEWAGRPASEEDRRSWGYMPQERGLYRDMCVIDQLTWIARLYGLEKATGEARADDLLQRLGLADRGRDKVQDLSWFVLGLALYLTMAGALGALVERQEEAGSAVMPLTAILIGTFLVAQSSAESPLGTVLAYVPLTSPLLVPTRIAVGASSPVELVVSLVLLVVAIGAAARVGSTIYSRATVRTGRRLKLREVLGSS